MKNDIEITENLVPKFLAGEASPEEAMEVEDWASRSDANRAFLDSSYRIFNLPGRVQSTAGNKAAWGKIVAGIEKDEKAKRTKVTGWYIGIAASILLLVFIGVLVNHSRKNPHDLVYNTNTKKLKLDDATEIILSSNSTVTVDKDFGRSNRKIKLTGSASFSVVHHKTLPLIVDMNGFYVQDLGTKFTITSSANADTIYVAVQKGEVSAYDGFGSRITINAQQQALYIRSAKKLAMLGSNQTVLKTAGPNAASNSQGAAPDTVNRALTDSNKLFRPDRAALADSDLKRKDNAANYNPAPVDISMPGNSLLKNTPASACDCDDTPPFKRFEKLDLNALSPAEYKQPDLLVKALQSGNAEKRAMAVRQLGKLQSDKYLDEILAMMADNDCMVRIVTVNALGKFRDEKVGRMLLANIHDPACFVREEIAGELGKYNLLNGVEAALITLSKDNSANVVSQALYSLKYYKDDNLGKQLVSHLRDKDKQTKVAAIYALKSFRADSIAVLLTAELKAPDKHVRQATAEVLKYYNPKIARPALLTCLKADTNEHVQLAIIESLAAVGDDSVISPLLPFVTDKRSIIRQLTVRTLGAIGNKSVIPYIETASHDENSFVRKEAKDVLKKLSKN